MIPYTIVFRRFDGTVERLQRWAPPMTLQAAYAYFAGVPAEVINTGGNVWNHYGYTGTAADVLAVEGSFNAAGVQAAIQEAAQRGDTAAVAELQQLLPAVAAAEGGYTEIADSAAVPPASAASMVPPWLWLTGGVWLLKKLFL